MITDLVGRGIYVKNRVGPIFQKLQTCSNYLQGDSNKFGIDKCSSGNFARFARENKKESRFMKKFSVNAKSLR